MREQEEWKPIKDFENSYEVSNMGRIKSLERKVYRGEVILHKKERILNTYFTSRGYYTVKLYYGNRKFKSKPVHRLVAQEFLYNPNTYPQINHRDGNRENNNVNNLEWCTISMNTQHAYDTGLKHPENYMGEANVTSKLNNEKVRLIREKYEQGVSYKELSREFNVVQGTIGFVVKRQTWNHI